MREEQFRKLAKFMMLPLVILILIVVILITDHGKGGTRKGAKGNRATEAETGVSTEAASEDEKEESGQAEAGQAETEQETRAPYDHANAVPERSTNEALVGLAKDYLDAYVRGDADAMYRIFGRTDQTGLEGLRQKMSANTSSMKPLKTPASMRFPAFPTMIGSSISARRAGFERLRRLRRS